MVDTSKDPVISIPVFVISSMLTLPEVNAAKVVKDPLSDTLNNSPLLPVTTSRVEPLPRMVTVLVLLLKVNDVDPDVAPASLN